eukprot:13763855-Alexandrium_andersonii.AAC.1
MSASLVGSEMCIRDSVLGRTGAYWNVLGPTWTCESVLGRTGTYWDVPGPVSYTHLTLPTICSV